ncbi:MAG: hypothetical protein J7M18_00005, partial [Candidatus Eremiobacteraeota bacterium]|nr:hypothetical protein [Candidatus Eremiobacteraeota bacterium]
MKKKKKDRDLKRFVGRKEYFGSLIFDREIGDWIPFDQDATIIFEKSKRSSIDNIYKKLEDKLERKSFDTFIKLSKIVKIFNSKENFTRNF